MLDSYFSDKGGKQYETEPMACIRDFPDCDFPVHICFIGSVGEGGG